MPCMIETAIQNAKFHGINLFPGTKNPAQGDCVFESVIDNINLRHCFSEKLSEDPSYWRCVWLNEIERLGFDYWNMGRTKEEWKTEFDLMKQPGVYEVPLFDLVPSGIAHCIKKIYSYLIPLHKLIVQYMWFQQLHLVAMLIVKCQFVLHITKAIMNPLFLALTWILKKLCCFLNRYHNSNNS